MRLLFVPSPGPRIDILFLVNAAAASAVNNFETMKNVTQSFVEGYHRDSIKYSYITYGSDVTVRVKFDDVIISDGDLQSIISSTVMPNGPPALDR